MCQDGLINNLSIWQGAGGGVRSNMQMSTPEICSLTDESIPLNTGGARGGD